jgi:acyl carrier protein
MIDRAQALKAVETSASKLNLHPQVTEEMKISDFCGDSLEYLEFLMDIEDGLHLSKEIPEAHAPSMDVTAGQLADWIVEVANG